MPPHNLKFGILDSLSREVPYQYSDEWALDQTTGSSRLVIASRINQVALLRALSSVMNEPFYLLYVLVVPRRDQEAGRYESSDPHSKQQVFDFLNCFEKFLESDGRHHLWIKSMEEPDLLVYDRHNLTYAYGDLEKFKKVLATAGLAETPSIKIPSPHVHYYHGEYDANCKTLLGYWDWRHSPLLELDER